MSRLLFRLSLSLMPHSSKQQPVKSEPYMNMTELNTNNGETAFSFELDEQIWHEPRTPCNPFTLPRLMHLSPSANHNALTWRPQRLFIKGKNKYWTLMYTNAYIYYTVLPAVVLNMLCINFNHLWHSISYLRMCSIHHFFINPEKLFWQSIIAKISLSLYVSLYLSVTQTHKYLCCQARCVWVITQQNSLCLFRLDGCFMTDSKLIPNWSPVSLQVAECFIYSHLLVGRDLNLNPFVCID